MNDLRIFLLVAGVCLLIAIYLWNVFLSRKQELHKQHKQTIHEKPTIEEPMLSGIKPSEKSDIDYSNILSGISNSRTDPEQPAPMGSSVLSHEKAEMTEHDSKSFSAESDSPSNKQEKTSSEDFAITAPEAAPEIVKLHIIARANELFSGESVLALMAELDMRFGPMNIFHHYGVGEMKSENSLFYLANMLEPGNFDMNEMQEFQTRGLVLFLCLPTEVDALVVFELMLNTGRRLAERLNADVCDEQQNMISEAKIDEIRNSLVSK